MEAQQEHGQTSNGSPKVEGGIHQPHVHGPVAQAMPQGPEANGRSSPTGDQGPAGQRKHETIVEGTTEGVL